jgi:hypothetical protein
LEHFAFYSKYFYNIIQKNYKNILCNAAIKQTNRPMRR